MRLRHLLQGPPLLSNPAGNLGDASARLAEFTARRRLTFYPKTDLPVEDAVLQNLRHLSATALGLTEPVVRAALDAAFPGAHPTFSLFPEQGTFHRLFLAELADGGRFILRFNVTGDFWGGLTLPLEQWAANTARRAGVPTPEIVLTDTTRRVCPFDFQIAAFSPNQSLRDFDDDEPAIRRLLPRVGATLAQLHSVAVGGFGWFDVRPLPADPSGLFPTWADYLLLRLDDHLELCRRIGTATPGTTARIRKHFAEITPGLSHFQPVLLHGDPGNHNLLTDGHEITALLDWEDCLAGDPIYEIAFWATFHPERRHGDFIAGYRAQRPLPSDFDARFWLYFLRVALAKTAHRHRFGYTDRPGRAPAAGRIALALERLEAALAGRP